MIGTVISVDPDHCRITIRQANLLGYLRMDMRTYDVTAVSMLANFRRGDRIKGTFSSTDGKLHRLRHVRNRPIMRVN